jgi:hypothetical protein
MKKNYFMNGQQKEKETFLLKPGKENFSIENRLLPVGLTKNAP